MPDHLRDSSKNTSGKKHLSIIGVVSSQAALVVSASVLFALSFPNPIFKNGLSFLAWFALIPVLIIIRKNNIPVCIGWGAVYGFLSYLLFNYWLGTFHPLAGGFVYCLYAFYMAAVFLLFKLADKLYPDKGYIVQWTIWIAYEYLRTKGFLGYPYGIIGYSQWQVIPLIQIASVTGVWGVSALVTFPSFWIGRILTQSTQRNSQRSTELRAELRILCVYLLLLVISLVYGFTVNKDFSDLQHVQLSLIQHNTDPWEADRAPAAWQKQELYRRDLNTLIRLSNEALAANPNTQIVVWPETAFIPRIHWHQTYREDQNSWLIVKDLLDYLARQDVPFLIGNDDGRRDPAKNPNEAEKHRVDYNAVMLFEGGVNTAIYRKLHLVPFTEHFPYKKQLPFIYKALESVDTFFWEKGNEKTVFSLQTMNLNKFLEQGPNEQTGFSFSTPICFEDTFGYLSRDFTLLGADLLINLTNDAWAKSISSQKQHAGMAVFRAVENSRSMARSTVSGQTCAIDPAGRITAEAPAFTESYINAGLPISKKTTIYTKYGDYFPIFFLFASLILLILKGVWYIIKR